MNMNLIKWIFVSMRLTVVSASLNKLTNTLLVVEVYKMLDGAKLQSFVTFSNTIIVLLITFFWKKYSRKFIKSAKILNLISIIVDISLAISFMIGLINTVVLFIYLQIISGGIFNSIFRRVMFKGRLTLLNKEELESFNNELSAYLSVSDIVYALLLLLIPFREITIGCLLIINSLLDKIFDFRVYKELENR